MKAISIFQTLHMALLAFMALAITACTDNLAPDMGQTDANPTELPPGVVALNFSLPACQPVFQEGGGGEAWTRTVPGFPTNEAWKEGDEVLVELKLTDTSDTKNEYIVYTTAKRVGDNWELQATDATYTAHYEKSGSSPISSIYSQDKLPMLYTSDDTGKVLGLRIPKTFTINNMKLTATIYHAPGNKWEYNPSAQIIIISCKDKDIKAGSTEKWTLTINATYNASSNTLALTSNGPFIASGSRLRVYLDAAFAGSEVRMYCPAFVADNYAGSGITSYTALVNDAGNACFYGHANNLLNGSTGNELTITLLNVPSTDGTHTTLFEASVYTIVDLTGNSKGKSFAIDGSVVVDAKKVP